MFMKKIKSVLKFSLPIIVLSAILIYCNFQKTDYQQKWENKRKNTRMVNARVIDISNKTYQHNDVIRYETIVEYRNPFNYDFDTTTTTNICEIVEPPNYCQKIYKNITVNSIISVHVTKYTTPHPHFEVDILKIDDMHHIESISWEFIESLSILVIMSIYGPFMLNYYAHKKNIVRYRKKQIFIMLIVYLTICAVSIGYVYSKYAIEHNKWKYVKTDMTISFIVKTDLSENNEFNLTRYDVFYKPNPTFYKYHGEMTITNQIMCPNHYFNHHDENNYQKCVEYHDEYYLIGNLITLYISKINPFDIQVSQPYTQYDKIGNVIKFVTITLWCMLIMSIIGYATNIVVQKYKKN